MKELSSEELKHVQLEVLQEFHNFCIAHKLKYSLCAGTLLGAIRHKGYIPWDDDIDVMMPRKEYNKFLLHYSSNEYSLYTYLNTKTYMIPYAKLCDNNTIVKEDVRYTNDHGVDIDIFPLDFFPDSIEESRKWSRELGYWKDIHTLKNLKWSKHRSIFKNIFVILMRIILSPISMKYLTKQIDLIASRFASKTEGYLGNMTNGYRMRERNPMAKRLIDVCFEGRMFKAISNYDDYLKGLFGDYMQFPPVDKRITHHGFKAFWK